MSVITRILLYTTGSSPNSEFRAVLRPLEILVTDLEKALGRFLPPVSILSIAVMKQVLFN